MQHIKTCLIISIFIVFFGGAFGQPTISGFNPLSGPIGTTVIITGTNFSSLPSNNFVRFGYSQATVIAASATSLTVQVPRGATLLPISVAVNQLTAYSLKAFNVTSACNAQLSFSSFDSSKSFLAGNGDWMISAGDLDGDGKTDIVYGNYSTGSNMCVHRNTSTPGNISMEPKLDYAVGNNPDDQIISDFDGDSKPDIIVTTVGNITYDLAIFRNTSTPGIISFAPITELNTGVVADKLAVADLDKDGKVDLIISFLATNNLGVLRNISTLGNIAFASVQEFPVADLAGFVSTGDIDGDTKIDIVASNFYAPKISILRNTSSVGAISFAATVDIPVTGNTIHGNAVADLDGDGKLDITAVYIGSSFVTVVKNTSSPGNISFQPATNISIAPSRSYNIAIDDLDGDLKPDLVFSCNYGVSSGYGIAVMKNISSGGNILFDVVQKYKVDYSSYISIVADMDNDSKPDVISGMGAGSMSGTGQPTISVLRNRLCEVVYACQASNTMIMSSIIGSNYQWQLDTGNGFNNLVNNSNYAGVNTNQLQILNIQVGLLNYKYHCVVDGYPTNTYTIKFGNTWLGTVNNVWENPANWSCGTIPDIYTDVIIPSGNVQLNSNTSVNSLTISPGATLTVAAGINLTVIH